jgi:hypothetical protein
VLLLSLDLQIPNMASAKKTSTKKTSKKAKEDPYQIAETKKRLKHQQEALKKIIKSFSSNKPKKED